MRQRLLIACILALSACARFEPRVSVETREAPGARPVKSATTPPKTASAPADYTVVRGDTLYGIAFRNRLDFRDLAAWNNINAPYTIYPGQGLRLKAPSRTTRVTDPPSPATVTAPPAARDPVAAATAPAQVEIAPVPMQPAETPAVAASDSGKTQTFAIVDDGTPVATPAPVAPLPDAASTAGTARPEASASAPPPANSPAAAIGLPATAPKPAPPHGPVPPPSADPPPASAPTAVDATPRAVVDAHAPIRERDGLRWRWPVNGTVVGRFVEGDPTQQGVDIGGTLGQPVLAAADGDVVYSGNGLIGYGELVIVQHSPGYLSAYGHNQKRLVVEGQKVKAGQPIAEMGRRGGIDMLHFEIRRNGKPVDPLGYLPNR